MSVMETQLGFAADSGAASELSLKERLNNFWALDTSGWSESEKVTFLMLVSHADQKGRIAGVSMKKLGAMQGLTDRQARRNVRALEQRQIIRVVTERANDRSQLANTYQL